MAVRVAWEAKGQAYSVAKSHFEDCLFTPQAKGALKPGPAAAEAIVTLSLHHPCVAAIWEVSYS